MAYTPSTLGRLYFAWFIITMKCSSSSSSSNGVGGTNSNDESNNTSNDDNKNSILLTTTTTMTCSLRCKQTQDAAFVKTIL